MSESGDSLTPPPPSTHGPDGAAGRGDRGRFAPGNRLGRGNPLAGRAAKIRAVLLKRLTPKDAAEIADVLIKQAKGGDLAAIKELLDRTIGRTRQPVDVTSGGRPLVKGYVDISDGEPAAPLLVDAPDDGGIDDGD